MQRVFLKWPMMFKSIGSLVSFLDGAKRLKPRSAMRSRQTPAMAYRIRSDSCARPKCRLKISKAVIQVLRKMHQGV